MAAAWSALQAVIILAAALLVGRLIGLPGGTLDVVLRGSAVVALAASMAIIVAMPFALLASIGRGYLLPLGVGVLVLLLTNLVALAGWGEYFPWAVPGLFAQGKSLLPAASYLDCRPHRPRRHHRHDHLVEIRRPEPLTAAFVVRLLSFDPSSFVNSPLPIPMSPLPPAATSPPA